MSRRGNCNDNAVAESFFQLLKRERVRRKVYATRDEARQDIFDYIEMFYNPKRRHSFNQRLSPVEFEKRHFYDCRVSRKMVAIHFNRCGVFTSAADRNFTLQAATYLH
jgi:putative transposase